jgi:hypothetical protein
VWTCPFTREQLLAIWAQDDGPAAAAAEGPEGDEQKARKLLKKYNGPFKEVRPRDMHICVHTDGGGPPGSFPSDEYQGRAAYDVYTVHDSISVSLAPHVILCQCLPTRMLTRGSWSRGSIRRSRRPRRLMLVDSTVNMRIVPVSSCPHLVLCQFLPTQSDFGVCDYAAVRGVRGFDDFDVM